jgi:hypothetical protein
MNQEPRHSEDYQDRLVEAARRVLIDVGQVLASFMDCVVVVGGWTPDLLLPDATERHIGSMDVDLALDAGRLTEGRYADLLKLLLDTRRYRSGEKGFQLVVDVDLEDGGVPIQVEVEFLASKDVKLRKNRPKFLKDFRVLQADACGAAFHAPVVQKLQGKNVRGAKNTVQIRVASVSDFLVMKAHAIGGRDKPKDSYDLCYCLEQFPGGIGALTKDWKGRADEKDVARAIEILREKFESVDAFGPGQLVEFYSPQLQEEQEMVARRAYELVQRFLTMLQIDIS